DPAAGGTPDVLRELRLPDEREPPRRIEDEQRHVVRADGIVRGDGPLDVADLSLPVEPCGHTESIAHRAEHGLVDVGHSVFMSARNSWVEPTTTSADARSSGGDSSAATATRTPSSSPSTARNASRSVVSSPATSARWRFESASNRRTAVPLFASIGGSTS